MIFLVGVILTVVLFVVGIILFLLYLEYKYNQ